MKSTESRWKNSKFALSMLSAAFAIVAAEGAFLAYTNGDNIRTIRPEIESRIKLPEASAFQCFYLDPTKVQKISFMEYPTGIVSGALRLYTPFMDSQRRTYDLGTAPVIAQAPCWIMKDDVALSPEQAQSLLADWQKSFLSGSDLRDALKEARSGEGFLKVVTGEGMHL